MFIVRWFTCLTSICPPGRSWRVPGFREGVGGWGGGGFGVGVGGGENDALTIPNATLSPPE